MTHHKISALVTSVMAHTRGQITTRTVTHPTRDWWLGLLIACGAAVVVIAWSATVYLEYKRDGFLVNFDPPATTQIYRPELVEQALTLMAKRADTRQQLLSAGVRVEVDAPTVEVEISNTTGEGILTEDGTVPSVLPDEPVPVVNDEFSAATTTTSIAPPASVDSEVIDMPFVDETPILE